MECYEGATMIKTFRGLIKDGAQDTIVLHTNDGSTGYRIVKFQLFGNNPGAAGYESIMKIYKVAQTTIDGTVDFSDQTLLAVSYLEGDGAPHYTDMLTTVFDHEIFNQDIHITHHEQNGSVSCNYYLELEKIKLDLSESTVATLKDIRNEHRIPPG